MRGCAAPLCILYNNNAASRAAWKAHWPMRLGVTLARARAALVTEGVRCRQQVAGDGQRDPEAEEKRVSMQYRA